MPSVTRCLILLGLVVVSLSITALAQTPTVIPDIEAARHVGQYITVEGVVVKVFTSKGGNMGDFEKLTGIRLSKNKNRLIHPMAVLLGPKHEK